VKTSRASLTAALAMASAWFAVPPARADAVDPPRLFLRGAVGPAFNAERWSPDGGSPGASTTGWAPAVNLAVGWRVRPRLVVAADLQVAPVVNRTESYRGGSYELADTLHFVDTLGVVADVTSWRHPRFHAGGGVGLMAATDVDTHMGSTATNLGVALLAQAGYSRPVGHGCSLGAMARLTFYRFGSEQPAPASTSVGLLPALLLTFTR
jgi:hypothetical protein